MYNPETYFTSVEIKNKQRRKIAKVREVMLNLDQGAVIPTTVQNKICNTLIDTGATRSCISEEFYEKIETTQLQSLYGLNVVSASGEDILPIGMVTCKFKIQNTPFEHNFIVCKRIRRPMILGLDFLRRHRIGTTWSDKGKFSLQKSNQILIESIEEFFGDDKPKLKTKSVVEIPARSLVVIHARVNIPPEHCERLFEATATEEMLIEHPQLATIPLVHRTAQRNYNTVPHVLD